MLLECPHRLTCKTIELQCNVPFQTYSLVITCSMALHTSDASQMSNKNVKHLDQESFNQH